MSNQTKTTILIVDDSDDVRRAVGRVLRLAGFEVQEAESGAEALARVAEPPDLVILDVQLGDMSGFEVCRRIRACPATRSIPILHLSAQATDEVSQATGLDEGADVYLTHPVDARVLVAHVDALLRSRRQAQSDRSVAKRWASGFDSLDEGVCHVDADGCVLRCNRAFAEVLGVKAGACPGKGLSDVLAAALSAGEADALAGAILGAAWQAKEVRIGTRRFWAGVGALPREGGRRGGSVLTLWDITEFKQREDFLRLDEQLFDELAEGLLLGMARSKGRET
ncbi:MAG: response regulator [Planctomycetes bacterium]|nr:response regulator [Planctomycetota bacterium]